jgi:hypothetical protein
MAKEKVTLTLESDQLGELWSAARLARAVPLLSQERS